MQDLRAQNNAKLLSADSHYSVALLQSQVMQLKQIFIPSITFLPQISKPAFLED